MGLHAKGTARSRQSRKHPSRRFRLPAAGAAPVRTGPFARVCAAASAPPAPHKPEAIQPRPRPRHHLVARPHFRSARTPPRLHAGGIHPTLPATRPGRTPPRGPLGHRPPARPRRLRPRQTHRRLRRRPRPTNQRETTRRWDRATGRPLAPALVWSDRRTAPSAPTCFSAAPNRSPARTGLLLDP